MAEIIWTEAALNDLDEIAEYIAISNFTAAAELVTKVFDCVDVLSTHPQAGKKPQEISYLQYRELVVNPCRIFYKYEGEHVYILHILRQERDLRRYIITQGLK
jgi:toxin ParE1/3/4